jgi:hypothetical protein
VPEEQDNETIVKTESQDNLEKFTLDEPSKTVEDNTDSENIKNEKSQPIEPTKTGENLKTNLWIEMHNYFFVKFIIVAFGNSIYF